VKRDEAIDRCAELNRDRGRDRQWFARQVASDDWELVSVASPELRSRGPLKEAVEARPKPSEPGDPRSIVGRHVPPYGAG
jgi:hypothetical protein